MSVVRVDVVHQGVIVGIVKVAIGGGMLAKERRVVRPETLRQTSVEALGVVVGLLLRKIHSSYTSDACERAEAGDGWRAERVRIAVHYQLA